MREGFPYQECEECSQLVLGECVGVTHWMLCNYLVLNWLEGLKTIMLKKEEKMFIIILEGNNLRGGKIKLEAHLAPENDKLEEVYGKMSGLMQKWHDEKFSKRPNDKKK